MALGLLWRHVRIAAACFSLVAGSDEVMVVLEGGGKVALSTRGPSAFRVRLILPDNGAGDPMWTPMVDPDQADAFFEKEKNEGGEVVGISTPFGSVKVSTQGTLQLWSASGDLITESGNLAESSTKLDLSSRDGQLYGGGASPDDQNSLTKPSSQPIVCNRATYTPYYYSTDGYGALGVVSEVNGAELKLKYTSDGSNIRWEYSSAFEIYLIPAPVLTEGTKAYYSLIGAPRVPPLYSFGFIASRWGWESKSYIEETVSHFRDWYFPIDAIICDFEWFTKENDYPFDQQGREWYKDFGFNEELFPEPKKQLDALAAKNIHFGGIRKPRLANTGLLDWTRSQGWIMEGGPANGGEPGGAWPPELDGAYALGRNIDFYNKDARDWYAWNLQNFTSEGIDFWWNDEGETSYFTNHWWNLAQIKALRFKSQSRRFYSLNRAWTPGMAKLGAAVWTGDIDPTWTDMQGTPGMMLNWILGGAPYVACDIGGFTDNTEKDLLMRWYQMGAFMPIMRVHSVISATPHWPWLWGQDAAEVMKHALELRYRLIPYHYSMAHRMYQNGTLWVRPLVMDFPEDPKVWHLTQQWMDGEILASPILNQDSHKSVYLPEGQWYALAATKSTENGGQMLWGPTQIDEPAEMDAIPAYVRAGAIVPLAPIIQHTGMLPGGPLEVQVYEGKDGTFDLVEDDGDTITYENGQIRTTKFFWDNEKRTLSWKVNGFLLAPGQRGFSQICATLVSEEGSLTSDIWPMGIVGAIHFKPFSEYV